MEFTGERFVPEVGGDIELEHLHRYLQACSIATNKIVLDIASGEGYGSSMLAEYAERVIGVDISSTAVTHANLKYIKANLEYRQGSCSSIPLPNASVDLIVSFETIEHHNEHEEMMSEIRRVLRPNGLLLISSPDKLYYSDLPGSHNEFHVKELYEQEFKNLINANFQFVNYFSQRIMYGSCIFPQKNISHLAHYTKEENKISANIGIKRPLYWIAVASNSALPELEAGILEQDIHQSDYVKGITIALKHRENDVVVHKQWIDHLTGDIAELKLNLDNIEETQNKVQVGKLDLDNANIEIKMLNENSKFITNLLNETKAAVVKLNEQITEQQQAISSQQTILSQLIIERDLALAQANSIRNSSSWKIMAPLRWLGDIKKGNFAPAKNGLKIIFRNISNLIPQTVRKRVRNVWGKFMNITAIMPHSSMNLSAIEDMVAERCDTENLSLSVIIPTLLADIDCPRVDICVVTHNSSKWLDNFTNSLLDCNYPKNLISVYFVDNGSTDNTFNDLGLLATRLREKRLFVKIKQQANLGFGAGQNAAFQSGNAPFCLISNVDLIFEQDALRKVIASAVADTQQVAAWELRQKPYEHPKYYDPITGSTNWNAYACVLIRRSALEKVKGFDENLFMYGEDVELSYRLRRSGFVLRYCPNAVVWHFTYETAGQSKRLQYSGSTFANLYIRLKYGNKWDALAVPLLSAKLLRAQESYLGSRKDIFKNLIKLFLLSPKILISRSKSDANFPFREWDYEMIRDGAFVELCALPKTAPLVTVITRTYVGRQFYLKQALISVAKQTYPNVEHIIVEDGGEAMRTLVENFAEHTTNSVRFYGLPKCGRSATGNHGLLRSKGKWCLFLDDDDLLFADHIEVLVNTLIKETDACAAYSLAWEVVTDNSNITNNMYKEVSYQVPHALRQEYDYAVLRHHNFLPIQSVLFERSLYEQRGGFDEDMEALEDWTLWVKYAHGNKFIHVPKLTSLFRTPFDLENINNRINAFEVAYSIALTRNISNSVFIEQNNKLRN